jgi:hypothetical protein
MSGPLVNKAVSSAGVVVPVAGAEAIGVMAGSTEYPLTVDALEDVEDTFRD